MVMYCLVATNKRMDAIALTSSNFKFQVPLLCISLRIASTRQLSQGPHKLLRRSSVVIIHIARTDGTILVDVLVAVAVVWVVHRTVVVVQAWNDPFGRFVTVRVVTRLVVIVVSLIVVSLIIAIVFVPATTTIIFIIIVGVITTLAVAIVATAVGSVGRRIAGVLFVVVTAITIIVFGVTEGLVVSSRLAIR